MALQGSSIQGQRFEVKLFTGPSVESDVNTWLTSNPGPLVSFHLSHDGTNPVVLALYRPAS